MYHLDSGILAMNQWGSNEPRKRLSTNALLQPAKLSFPLAIERVWKPITLQAFD